MKLMRHGPIGSEKPALVDAQGVVRDLSGVLSDIVPATLSPHSLQRLREIDPATLPALVLVMAKLLLHSERIMKSSAPEVPMISKPSGAWVTRSPWLIHTGYC